MKLILYVIFGSMISLTILFREINLLEYALFCILLAMGLAILIIAESNGKKQDKIK